MGKINAALAVDPWLAENPARWDFICDTVPAEVAADSPLVKLLLACATDSGRPSEVAGLNSWHDAATYTRFGIPTVSFGPGGLETAHAVDESVAVDDLVDYCAAAARAIMRFCGC